MSSRGKRSKAGDISIGEADTPLGRALRGEKYHDRIRRLGSEAAAGQRESLEALRAQREYCRGISARLRGDRHEPAKFHLDSVAVIEEVWRAIPFGLRRGAKRRWLQRDIELHDAVSLLRGEHERQPECPRQRARNTAGKRPGRARRFDKVTEREGIHYCQGHTLEEAFSILESIGAKKGRKGTSAKELRERYMSIRRRIQEEQEQIDGKVFTRIQPGFLIHEGKSGIRFPTRRRSRRRKK